MGKSTTETTETKSRSPKQAKKQPPQEGSAPSAKNDSSRTADSASTTVTTTKPLAPPPRPGTQQQQSQQASNTPDYFGAQAGGSLSLEPNPFEQSFGGGGPETPGGTKLPSVAALTSPSSLLPGTNATPFNWGGGSLRTGPLSPAMLSGPANDYFGDTHHLRGGFPTPNESSLRSGLTPGGSGSMFPAPSPNSQALFAQLASGGATPSTLDFHRTALSAAAKRDQTNGAPRTQPQQAASQSQSQPQPPQQPPQSQQPPVTTTTTATTNTTNPQPPTEMPNGTTAPKVEAKPASGPFDPHDNDAANGLFMLAQGRNGTAPPANAYGAPAAAPGHAHPAPAAPAPHGASTSPQMKTEPGRGVSEVSNGTDDSDQTKPQGRGKGKKGTSAANGRRKAEEVPDKPPPNKKPKASISMPMEEDMSDDEDADMKDGGEGKGKMTDEEKRKNFLERNRVAALKCRQRKKQWLANLQTKVELFSSENDALTQQITQLREEVLNLKTLLLAHKDCPITQQQGLQGAFMPPHGYVSSIGYN